MYVSLNDPDYVKRNKTYKLLLQDSINYIVSQMSNTTLQKMAILHIIISIYYIALYVSIYQLIYAA